MNLLIQHIEYLISRNDCVVIPRLGALLSQYCPAHIDTETGIVYPPSRKFTFNSGIRDNDATLAVSISKATGVSCQKAIDIVNKEVDSMLHQLHSLGSLSLGRAGTLRFNASDGTCEFEPFSSDRLSVGTSWLPAVPVIRHTADTDDMSGSSERNHRHLWSKVTRVAAMIAVLIGVWFVASTPVSLDNKSVLTASLAPDISRANTPAIFTAAQKAINGAPSDKANKETSACESPVNTLSSLDNEIGDMTHGKFYIIVGATVSSREARKFIELHPDIKDEAFIVRYGKKHVISVSLHDTPEEANTACIERRKTYPTAWIGTN